MHGERVPRPRSSGWDPTERTTAPPGAPDIRYVHNSNQRINGHATRVRSRPQAAGGEGVGGGDRGGDHARDARSRADAAGELGSEHEGACERRDRAGRGTSEVATECRTRRIGHVFTTAHLIHRHKGARRHRSAGGDGGAPRPRRKQTLSAARVALGTAESDVHHACGRAGAFLGLW